MNSHLLKLAWVFLSVGTFIEGCTKAPNDETLPPYYMINNPCGLSLDQLGDIYFANLQDHNILEYTTSGTYKTIAGIDTVYGCVLLGGKATVTRLNTPEDVALDGLGNIYITDELCWHILKVDASTGIINSLAGNGNPGFSGDGGPATSAELNDAEYIASDSAGNVYIADNGNNRVRRVDHVSGIITTVAGDGIAGCTGNGGPATAANIEVIAVALDDSDNIYIAGGNWIRKVCAATGIIETIGGSGISTYNGDGIQATSAGISPYCIVLDTTKNIYFTDPKNYRVRKINYKTGIINTIAGTGVEGIPGSSNADDGFPANEVNLIDPIGIGLDKLANVYFSDAGYNRIRRIDISTGIITSVIHN